MVRASRGSGGSRGSYRGSSFRCSATNGNLVGGAASARVIRGSDNLLSAGPHPHDGPHPRDCKALREIFMECAGFYGVNHEHCSHHRGRLFEHCQVDEAQLDAATKEFRLKHSFDARLMRRPGSCRFTGELFEECFAKYGSDGCKYSRRLLSDFCHVDDATLDAGKGFRSAK